ncbi:MAG TPA: ABC transporter permease [Caldilineae bacterium]|nr:ABC transporter permease [Caldilineae bacterium]
MNKIWSIATKDTLIRFRDRNGILLMLVAPLALAAIMGAAFGGFGGDAPAPIADIPIVIVNQDRGDLGQTLADILESADLAELLEPVEAKSSTNDLVSDLAGAKQQVERGEMRAVVVIPPDFSDAVRSQQGDATAIDIFTDPASTFSPIIVEAVVSEIANSFNAGIVGGRVGVMQLLEHQNTLGPRLATLPTVLAGTLSDPANQGGNRIDLKTTLVDAQTDRNMNPLAYFAPSMAILFLMFTLFDASRSILEEEREGTLQRMMSSPTRFAEILAGKNGGVMLTGVLQLGILVVVSSLLFGLSWGGSPLGVALMIVAVVAAASSLGAFIVAFAKDARQAAVIGSALALIFAILGGNFFMASALPGWLQVLSKLTINRWALDGFTDLSLRGGGLNDVLLEIGVLLGMSAIFFALAVWRLPRRFVR